ncbi:MAG TPA: hypothetical protein VLC98_08020 [Phnomibacter sp.]|nr:hypothetical protein [Phnomibacter sp.]
MSTAHSVDTSIYEQLLQQHRQQLKKYNERRSRISWARLTCIAIAVWLIYMQWPLHAWWQVLPSVALFALFLRLVVWSVNLAQQIQHTEQLIAINEDELKMAEGHFVHRYNGEDFAPANHAYAQDLDLFGRASLYQYLQRTESFSGQQTLASWLVTPASLHEIQARQQAVQVLAPAIHWRQQLQASGKLHPVAARTGQRLLQWITEPAQAFSATAWRWIRWVGPVISIAIVTAYFMDILPGAWFNLYLAVFFLLTGYISKLATPTWHSLSKMADEINTLSQLLQCIEQMPAGNAEWLKQQQDRLTDASGTKASQIVALLNGILKRFDFRLNPLVFVPLNMLLFWDLQQMLAFAQWKKQHAAAALHWVEVLGNIEAVSSLATLSYNHPQYAFPEFDNDYGTCSINALGHPLIHESKRVVSDFATSGNAQVSIITGSNMAGKSTFLRSVGLAMVMAHAGAPVCGTGARFSHMQVMSSMRIADNLEESTSTFYAELKKLQSIIEAVNAGQPVFLLLDEILRGTNSGDRHTGSAALIRQLIRHGAVGLIATHDLALANIAQQYPAQVHNYHFDVQVSGEELYFDYALKQGVCQSLNASILMKKIGIEMNESSPEKNA